MKSDAIGYGIAGIAFGLIAGWVIGSQQPATRGNEPAPPAAAAPAAGAAPAPAAVDESKINSLKAAAEREPGNATPRVELANIYFDAERYPEAIQWYGEALKLDPKNV